MQKYAPEVLMTQSKTTQAHANTNPSSPQSLRLYLLGQEAVEQEEEDPVAAGHAGGRPRGHRPHRRHRHPRHDPRDPRLRGEEGEVLPPWCLTIKYVWFIVRIFCVCVVHVGGLCSLLCSTESKTDLKMTVHLRAEDYL